VDATRRDAVGSASSGGDTHARFLRTAAALRPEADPQVLLGAVVDGLLDLDLGDGGDQVSLHLGNATSLDVVATLPPERPRISSASVRRAVETTQLVVHEDARGNVVAAPLVRGGVSRGALAVRRPADRPLPDVAAVELAAVLLAGAATTQRWLDRKHELDVARADFVGRVSHELRTPLTIISGFAYALGAQAEELDEVERSAMLDRIVTASVRLEHLVEELLTLASVELGQRTAEPVPCLVRDVLDLVVRDQGGTDRTQVRCAADLRVVTDPVLARLVIGPVVENALDHGDRVVIEAERTTAGVRVTVLDDGPGVPNELGDRIFDRFVRGDDTRPGLGLGLATATQIAEVIDAQLSLQESVAGARVAIDLVDADVPPRP
jgi:signal transduction histidine kinase